MKTIIARSLLFLAVCIGDLNPASAQRSIDAIRQDWSECTAKMAISREYLALKPKIGAGTPSATGFHGDRVTPVEARQLQTLLEAYLAPCRPLELEAARILLPPMVPVLETAFAKADANYGRLIAGDITWGEFRQVADALGAEVEAEIHRLTSPPSGQSLGYDPTDPAKR